MKKSVVITMLIILMLIPISFGAIIGYCDYVPMPVYIQEKSNWCWNATSRMAADFRYDVTKTQTDVAKHMFFGLALNSGLSLDDIPEVLEYYTNNTKSANYIELGASEYNPIASYLINTHNPVVWVVDHEYYGVKHALVLKFYDNYWQDEVYGYVDPYDMMYETYKKDTLISLGRENIGIAFYEVGEW